MSFLQLFESFIPFLQLFFRLELNLMVHLHRVHCSYATTERTEEAIQLRLPVLAQSLIEYVDVECVSRLHHNCN